MWTRPLTSLGIDGTGLGGVRAVKAPPALTTIAHGVLVGWSAARAERRRRVWKSARELAHDSDRWAVRMRRERGYTTQLPDLAVWLARSGPPIARIAESGGRREDRQMMILEGWRNAVYAGQYSKVLYDCTNESIARWISRLAKKAQFTRSELNVVIQARSEEIASLAPASDDEVPPDSNADVEPVPSREVQIEPAPGPEPSVPAETAQPAARPEPRAETPEEAAERERRYREIFGIPEPKPRRRWRR